MSDHLKRSISSITPTPSHRPVKQSSKSPSSRTTSLRGQSEQSMARTYFNESFFADQGPDTSDDDDDAAYSQHHSSSFILLLPTPVKIDFAYVQKPTSGKTHDATRRDDTPVSSQNTDPGVRMHSRLDLYTMSMEARQAIYADMWSETVIALSELRTPNLCEQFPALAGEIQRAYMEHITVSASVWVNYDGRFRRFFLEPKRVEDCGKVYLSPKQRARLRELDWADFEIKKLRLDIGTPFRTLLCMWLSCKNQTEAVGFRPIGQCQPSDKYLPEHELIMHLADHQLDQLCRTDQWNGQDGFTLDDIDNIADLFQCAPMSQIDLYRFFMD